MAHPCASAASIVEALCDRLLRLLLVWLLTSAASASASLRRLCRDLLLLLRAYSGGHQRPFLLCDVDILTSDERSDRARCDLRRTQTIRSRIAGWVLTDAHLLLRISSATDRSLLIADE